MFRGTARMLDEVSSRGYFRRMHVVGLKTLKNKLSEYVRLAASGETVVITDRNRIVAEIVPPRRDASTFFERGVREGWLSPPTNATGEPPPRHPLVPFEELMEELERDREDR
jgi:prevent-host-death family protein